MKEGVIGILLAVGVMLAPLSGAVPTEESGGGTPGGEAFYAETVPPSPEEGSGVFQSGAFSGPQTVPGQPGLLEAEWAGELYQIVYNGWKNGAQSVSVAHLDIRSADNELLWDILPQVINDHPELFYASWYHIAWDNWSAEKGWRAAEVQLQYYDYSYYGYSGIDQARAAFDAAMAQALAVVEPGMTDLEKVLALHDYLVLHCAYNWEVATRNDDDWWQTTQNKQLATAFGALVNGDAICQSYSLAYKLLLDRLGIGCIMIGSEAMNHVWNGVQLGGNWYQTDVTWDDPTPDMKGCCGHTHFLLSDETFGDETHKHHDWEQKVACTDASYESGQIFNGSNHALYRRNGTYYYTREDNTALISLYRTTSLSEAGQVLRANPGGSFYQGVVWLDDDVYYVPYASDGDYRLMRCNLDTGKVTQLDPFRFEKAPAPNGEYPAGYDGIGLCYQPDGRCIEIVSRTRRAVLESFPLPLEPSGWDALAPDEAISIAGLTADGTAAGVLWGRWNAAGSGGLTLWAAYYRDGRMVAVRGCEVPAAVRWAGSPDLTFVRIGAAGLPAYDQVRLMLVSGSAWTPACGAWTGQAA